MPASPGGGYTSMPASPGGGYTSMPASSGGGGLARPPNVASCLMAAERGWVAHRSAGGVYSSCSGGGVRSRKPCRADGGV